jgi:cellulose synthase/poly-beta-1,6-N-acetylglucosamine synthase-like glycosyltransferase
MAEWCFAAGVALLIYTYAGYPLLMLLLSRIAANPVRKSDIAPRVSLIVTAYNEETAIARKIDHTLALDYPRDKLEIIVASDGSTDRTNEIVESYASSNVRLIRVAGRRGKTAAQNEAVRASQGEIVVFTDATTVLEKDVIRNLVRNFADPGVGCVGGELRYVNTSAAAVGSGAVSYWHYERALKKWESIASSLIGVSGCLYAVRKSIYRDMPPELMSDFAVAMETYQQGYRVAYEGQAVACETALSDPVLEFAMRVRVAIRSYTVLWRKRELLNPFRHGIYAIQLLSHKVSRYAAPLYLLDVWIANAFLLEYVLLQVFFAAQCAFYAVAMLGHWLIRHRLSVKLLAAPYYFVLANTAALVALARFIGGDRIVVWKPVR